MEGLGEARCGYPGGAGVTASLRGLPQERHLLGHSGLGARART